ncbi:AcrR family transcriptional regulator [Actinoplanes tereljensis]|uniref:TetR family transcriptional regulator n=1 Tax=Paractinoplanes tereljensis TaxID=571912 RepID=A0A919TSP2_9ACTN|nr:TetR/AcrR family transcriptional regulator [Actinoplanes tereljensis]GIF20766.1 TetR family transcriptional regulator [Actinoplanes tereljensis]
MPRPADPTGRDRILSTATALFYTHGVRAVGMAQVIEAAACGKHMLYRHFPSKAALAAAYLEQVRTERDRSAGAAVAEASDPAAQLVALVAEVAAWTRRGDYRGCAFRNYLTEFPTADDDPARVARAYLRDTRHQIDDLVRDLGKPPLVADRLWLLIDALYAATGSDPEVAVSWARELV